MLTVEAMDALIGTMTIAGARCSRARAAASSSFSPETSPVRRSEAGSVSSSKLGEVARGCGVKSHAGATQEHSGAMQDSSRNHRGSSWSPYQQKAGPFSTHLREHLRGRLEVVTKAISIVARRPEMVKPSERTWEA